MGNIIGEGFDPYVIGQIKQRQKIYGSSNRSDENIRYTNANSAWIKLSSAVNIDATISTKLNTSFSDEDLARANVLFGGIGTTDGKDIKGGFGNSTTNTTQGYRPNPGITSFETKNKNRGSLREGTISLKCYSTEQFNIIDTLYLRLGYGVLIEWGHTLYYDNNGKFIEHNNTNTLTSKFLTGTFNDNSDLLRKEIKKKQNETNGNYDAFYARIVNFDWTFESDGTYNINLKLISWGDIIESLKINTLQPGKKSQTTEQKTATQKRIDSADNQIDAELINYSRNKSKIHGDLSREIASNKALYTLVDGIYISKPSNAPENLWESVDDFISYNDTTGISDLKYFVRLGGLIKYLNERCLLYDKEGKNLIKIDNTDTNYIFTTPNVLSSYPRKCIVKVNISTTGLYAPIFRGLPKQFTETINGVFVGNLMNVYINVKHIVEILNSNEDEKGNIDLFTFLKKIGESISSSLGGLNSIEPVIDETENRIYLVDETQIPGIEKILTKQGKPTELAKFAIFGFKPGDSTFVYDFGIKTEITNDMATMLSIGAQSNGVAVGEDATAFSKWNKGLTDRVIPEKVDYEKTNKTPETPIDYSEVEENYSNFLTQILNINEGKGKIDDGLDDFSSQLNAYLQYKQASKSMIDNTSSGTIGFIPISLNLSMVGLSGMKIFQKYSIDNYFLPLNYPETINFILKGITQKIEGNKWTTSIDGFCEPTNLTEANTDQITYTKPQINNTQNTNGNSGAAVQPSGFVSDTSVISITGVTRGQCGTATENPIIPKENFPESKAKFREEAITKAHSTMFIPHGQNEGEPHLCARWTYNMAINYTNLLKGQPAILNKTNILPAGGAANQLGYWKNLINVGYTQHKVGINLPKDKLLTLLGSSNFQDGDIVVYWDNKNPSMSFSKFGHTQIYLGNKAWSTDKIYNYGTKTSPLNFVYRKPTANLDTCWNLYVFKAPLGNPVANPEFEASRLLYEDYVKILIKVLQRKDGEYLTDTAGNGIPLIGSLVNQPNRFGINVDDAERVVGRLNALFGYTSQTIDGKPVLWNNLVPHTSLKPEHQVLFKYYFKEVMKQIVETFSNDVDFRLPSKTQPTKYDIEYYYLIKTDLELTKWETLINSTKPTPIYNVPSAEFDVNNTPFSIS
jgi:hypothetical protein